jgi:hypothetical protein
MIYFNFLGCFRRIKGRKSVSFTDSLRPQVPRRTLRELPIPAWPKRPEAASPQSSHRGWIHRALTKLSAPFQKAGITLSARGGERRVAFVDGRSMYCSTLRRRVESDWVSRRGVGFLYSSRPAPEKRRVKPLIFTHKSASDNHPRRPVAKVQGGFRPPGERAIITEDGHRSSSSRRRPGSIAR